MHRIDHIISHSAKRNPEIIALEHRDLAMSYGQLELSIGGFAAWLQSLSLDKQARIATYLPKCSENVIALFGSTRAGRIAVPINPALKKRQVCHILQDCAVEMLITQKKRAASLTQDDLPASLKHIVIIDDEKPEARALLETHSWPGHRQEGRNFEAISTIDRDIAMILYTSGSTGRSKGVVLSHANMLAGAHSVASYLENDANDRILSVLPLSFDYGLSQLTTAFLSGATIVLLEHLFPTDVVKAVDKYRITGLAAVPPLWNQLSHCGWPQSTQQSLRYITNSGGVMPRQTLEKLRSLLPTTKPILMYGLTEAFRSTYLPYADMDRKKGSMGKAIPNADVRVIDENGEECKANQPGELVHRGALVSLGYWNLAEKTAERFKPWPIQQHPLSQVDLAVWSGDQVTCDEDGYFYFVGRKDDMIKTSGFRVSPFEVEEVALSHSLVKEAAALGVAHDELGAAILLLVVCHYQQDYDEKVIQQHLKTELANFMQPKAIICVDNIARNANGKIDYNLLKTTYQDIFKN